MSVVLPPSDSHSPFEFWAFISYSSRDRAFAKWLHDSLETYRLPVQLIEHPTPTGDPAPKRFRPMFWDRAEMTADHDLGAMIKRNLRVSRYLIVVCSPHAARSVWVDTEVKTFEEMHGRERILSVIIDGDPSPGSLQSCYPPSLRGWLPKSPDARPEGDGRSNAKLMLLARMLGIRFDDLYQRERRRRRKALLLWSAGAAVVTGLMAMFWLRAHEAGERAETATARSLRGEYLDDMASASERWVQGDTQGLAAIVRKYERPTGGDPRSFEWRFWNRLIGQPPPRQISVAGAGWMTVEFHPTESRLLAVDSKRQFSVWDTAGGTEIFRQEAEVRSAEFTRDGNYIVTLSPPTFDPATGTTSQETVRLWNARDGSPAGSFTAALGTFRIAVSPKGDQIAMGDLNGVVSVAAFPSGEDREELNTPRRNPSAPTMLMSDGRGPVTELTWREDGYFFASGHGGGTVVVWSTRPHLQTMSHRHAELKKPHQGPVTGIAFTPDARGIVSQSMGAFDSLKNRLEEGGVIVWTAATGDVLSEWIPHGSEPFLPPGGGTFAVDSELNLLEALNHMPGGFRPAFGARERLILTTGERGVKVWDSLSGGLLGEPLRTNAPVSVVTANAEGDTLACVSGDTIFLTGLDRRSAAEVCSTERILYSMTLSPDGARVAAISESAGGRGFSYEGGLVTYSRSLDRELRVWDAADGRELLTREVHPPNGIWFPRDASVVGHGLERFDSRTGEPVAEPFQPDGEPPFIHPSPDGTRGVAVPRSEGGGVPGTADLLTGTVTPWSDPPETEVRLAAISADNQLAAVATAGGRIEVRELEGGVVRWTFTSSSADPTALTLSRDGRLVAVGGMNRIIEVWDTQTQALRHRLTGHRREISSLAFSSDDSLLAAASGLPEVDNSGAGEVRLWDPATGELRIEFPADLHAIYPGVAISPDGNRVYAIACDPRAQPDEVLVLMSPGGGRLLPPSMPEAPTTSRIIYWDAAAK